jgi:hypothetical protein
MKAWTPSFVKYTFQVLLQHMRDTAASRGIRAVELAPGTFSKVVAKKYVFSISPAALSAAVAKAVAKMEVKESMSIDTPRRKKRRLSDFVLASA